MGNPVAETPRLAECVGEVRLLLRQILSESSRYCGVAGMEADEGSGAEAAGGESFAALREHILDECHTTFTECFHTFYPTHNLKWLCLCELLATAATDPVSTVQSMYIFISV